MIPNCRKENIVNLEQYMPELFNWACNSYNYGTPSDSELTTYLTKNNYKNINKIREWAYSGTLVKASGIISSADSNSIYSRLYMVSYSYGYDDIFGNKYQFETVNGNFSFYISIPAGSQTQYMWNTWINADNDNWGCLTENTLVLTKTDEDGNDEFVKAKNLKVGDSVLTLNEETKEIESKQITEINIKEKDVITTISTLTQNIQLTNTHLVYNKDLELVPASKIVSQNMLLNTNMEEVKVGNCITRHLDDLETVYEIIVEDNHNLFISKDKVLVHNGS